MIENQYHISNHYLHIVIIAHYVYFSESLVIFSGGLPTDKAGRTHSITVLNGKSTTVLEMEHAVVDFVTLCETPHTAGNKHFTLSMKL